MDIKAFSVKRIIAAVGLVILLFLVLDFNSRMAELTRLKAQFQMETTELEDISDQKISLATQIAYASSDSAIEKWAREEGRYFKPGDHVIIPLPDSSQTIKEAQTLASGEESVSPWQWWKIWLFGENP